MSKKVMSLHRETVTLLFLPTTKFTSLVVKTMMRIYIMISTELPSNSKAQRPLSATGGSTIKSSS